DPQPLQTQHRHPHAEHLPGAQVPVCLLGIAKVGVEGFHGNRRWSLVVGQNPYRRGDRSQRPTTNDERPRFTNFQMEKTMKTDSKSKILLALVLAIALAATGCSAQWINTALQDLPVLTQMALNIATLVTTLAAGQQASAADTAVIQNISAQASRDLNLLQTLYNEYKASPSPTTLQKLQAAISDLNQNLPTMLQSAHISNATLSARITAAVNLILTTVNSFAALMPQ